jgi:hypothetical protein
VLLHQLRLECWGPFLFVCADPETPFPLGDLRLPFDAAGLVIHTRQDYALEANWKIAVENYLESYLRLAPFRCHRFLRLQDLVSLE